MRLLPLSTSRWLWAIFCILHAHAADAEGDPTKWEQLFFPFPIVGAPPQLEQQIQIFDNYFRGDHGSGDVASAELGFIVSPHFGVVVTLAYQLGIDRQPTGLQDTEVLLQYLAAGSLADDDMLSIGLAGTFPTGQGDLSEGDYFAGPFAYGAKRWFHRLVLEADATALLPIVHGASARQIVANGMVSVMVTSRKFAYPIYAQVEVDSTTYLDGTAALPPGASSSPAEALFVAPEVFVGPFASPIDEGTRLAAGMSFELAGDPVHRRTFVLTPAFDIPNKYGY